jgi:hypothetical protein
MGAEGELRVLAAMNTYPQRVAQRILPLSRATTLPEAFKERQFTHRITEDEEVAADSRSRDFVSMSVNDPYRSAESEL